MVKHRIRLALVLLLTAAFPATTALPARAQHTTKPFALPFDTPPGPNTWLVSQQYGNTLGAFNYGRYWYAAGQNLHFGVDFWAKCGTPVRAIADGVIDQVDNMSFGLEPHNLTIFHRELGLTSVYGHLYARPTLMKGQPVRRGDVVGLVGDPDLTCESRPHLHLEIRSASYEIAHNPMNLIEADWGILTSIGYHGFGGFVQDLYYPRRWQSAFDQPDVDFNEQPLNDFSISWPPPARSGPPPETREAFVLPPIPAEIPATLRPLTGPGCCAHPWWSPDSRAVRFWDGPDGQLAGVMEVSIEDDPAPPRKIADGPPRLHSPDLQWEITMNAGRVTLIRTGDGAAFPLATGGAWPRYSPGGTRLLWHRHPADNVPGGIPPLTELWIANADGSGRFLFATQQGGAVYWLDEDRILRVEPVGRRDESILSIYTISTRHTEQLAQFKHLRGLSVAPGGAILLFYLPFQDDPAASGIYGMVTRPGATPIKLPFFGSWRWRDSNTVLFRPYAQGQWYGALVLYDVTTGALRRLTDPSTQPLDIANDDWAVSPDGQHVVFWNATDSALWLLTLPR